MNQTHLFLLQPFLDWKHPLNVHPWYYAHQALRADFKDNIAALDKMITALEVDLYCRWMTTNYVKFTLISLEFLHHHHHMEDAVMFPLMSTRVMIEPQLGTEHEKVSDHINSLTKKINALATASNLIDHLKDIRAEMIELRDYLEPHLQEEEIKLLPALLRKFTSDEIDAVEQPAIKAFPWYMLPHYYRRLTKLEREGHMTDILGIPKFVQSLILSGNFKKYAPYNNAIEELKNPDLHDTNMANAAGSCVIA
jgi:hypothetical protein